MPLRLLKKLGEALRDKIAPATGDAQSKPPSTGRQAPRRETRPSGPRHPDRAPRPAAQQLTRDAPPQEGGARKPSPRRGNHRSGSPLPAAGKPAAGRQARGDGRGPRREAPPRTPNRPRGESIPEHAPPVQPAAASATPAVVQPWSIESFQVPVAEGRTRFHDFDLPVEIMHAIADHGFQYCTPIQAASLKQALAGANVAGRAQTGTGKTAAFLVAILSRYLRSPASRADKPGTPRALVIAPTRELCVQICRDAQALGQYCGLRSLAVFGGMDYVRQQRQLAEGPVDLLAATPGRLLDFQRQRVADLGRVDTLVIDEADRMLDMGFIPDVRRIVRCLPDGQHRQTLLYSATLSDAVMRLASQWMPNPVKIEIEPDHVASDTIEQKVFIVTSAQKFTLLCNLLRDFRNERVLIFGNRRMSTDRLAIRLRRQGFACELLSGDVQQTRRMRVLEEFRSGAVKIVVATDVAGRGLHIADIGLVVNFELPYEAEDYVHRIGRTGRAGKVGIAVSFACEDESFQIPEIEKFLGETLKCTLPDDTLLTPLPPSAPVAPRGERERPDSGAPVRYTERHGARGRGERPRREPPRRSAPRHKSSCQDQRRPETSARAETPRPEPEQSAPRPMEPRSTPRTRSEAFRRPPVAPKAPPARAIPPPSAATQPGHAHAQVWVPGGEQTPGGGEA
jgi:ATP-dependent RNA helicase RhlB